MKYEVDTIDETVVTLDTYNSDLNLVIDGSKYSAHPLTKEGFAFMWAGARATHGAEKGKFCFEVKVIEYLDVSHLPADEPNPHVVRVGFSVDSTSMQLGEDPLSYGYGGTGKISTKCQFKDFGPPFQAGDCILGLADMTSDPIQIGFAKNGKFIGWAYKVRKSELQGKALFPHVLTKNCSFEVNFGQREEPYFKLPDNMKEFTFISCLPLDQRIGGTRPPAKREDCEMIMMCGLPGAGKSVWAAEYSEKNLEKKYNVLGTNNIIDKMKVMGLPRKRNYAGRWDVLIQMATKCLNNMFAIGSKLRRNYILDQTNVYPTAQRRKMRNFDGFKRKAVVVVPSETEYKRRCDKRDREEGKEIPDSAVLEMKANFKLPEENDIFDDVVFTELQRDEAEKLVKKYNEEGKACVGPPRKQFRPNEPDNKGFDSNRKGNFGGYNRNDNSGGRGDTRGNFGNFQGDTGMRGPNTFGGNRGGYGGGRNDFENRGGFNGARGGSYGGRDNFGSDRGGFADRGGYGDRSYDDNRGGSREGFDSTYGSRSSSFDSSRGRGGYDNNRGSGRGGYDGNRGGGRGGYDNNRGGSRGGFDNRGGGRGGFDSGRGGGRGGYDNNRGSGRGGYDSGRGRGGFDSNRGAGRGGYDGGRGSGRGGYDGGRGRGGNDSNRGRGDFDTRGGARDSRDSFGSSRDYERKDSYGMYGSSGRDTASSGYGSDRGYEKTSRFEQTDTYSSNYGMNENIPGGNRRADFGYSDYGSGGYSTDQYSDQGYGSSASSDNKRGSSNARFQQSNRGAARGASRGGYQSDSYSKDTSYSTGYNSASSSDVQSSYSSRDYGSYGSTGYGGYKSQTGTDSYASRGTQGSSYSSGPAGMKNDPPQRAGGSTADTGSKYTGYSGGRATRWSADTSQTATTGSTDTYATAGAQSYSYTASDPSATSYTAQTQSYGYQQGVAATAAATPQQWMGSSVTSATTPTAYGTAQSAWYGQQMSSQYYSQ